MLDNVKKKRAETAAKKVVEAAAARTNVTVALNNNNNDKDLYKAHSYVTVASFVSLDLLKKAITNYNY